ncbi:MAG TPA: polyprenyl synthetase family protein [Candidatus Krumholzibacteriaceae bacterium]|nr:polyprenyl synthetase family protein [Candidatus Krumholzibacteriaceae bacterium]
MAQLKAIEQRLAENARIINGFLKRELSGQEPESLEKASLHLIEAGGKRLRPYLTIKACEAVGGRAEDAVPFAAAVEFLHNFTLVHDDVMDHDDLRRGKPTVHKVYGMPMAILAGDLLFAKVYDVIVRNRPSGMSPERLLESIDKVTEATLILCQGQALDISLPSASDVTVDDYIYMVGAKTSALFRACAQVGALAGGGSDEQVNALGSFAWDAGVAFQIEDDILGVTATEETLGKPVGSDIREGKKTLINIHALENATEEQRKLFNMAFGVEDASHEDIEAAVETLEEVGSIAYARSVADEYITRAFKSLDVIPDTPAKAELKTLIEYFVKREY